jgi:hypothetical protein
MCVYLRTTTPQYTPNNGTVLSLLKLLVIQQCKKLGTKFDGEELLSALLPFESERV